MKRTAFLIATLALTAPCAAQDHGEPGTEHVEHDVLNSLLGRFGPELTRPEELQLMASVVNFALLIGIFVWLARRANLAGFMKSRRAGIEEGLIEAKRLTTEAERKYADYSARLERMDAELAKLRKEMVQAGEAERDRIIAEAEARAARMRKDAQFVIDQRMKQLRADLTREAVEAAIGAAEDLLSNAATPQDQERLAKAYLAQLEETIRGGAPS